MYFRSPHSAHLKSTGNVRMCGAYGVMGIMGFIHNKLTYFIENAN